MLVNLTILLLFVKILFNSLYVHTSLIVNSCMILRPESGEGEIGHRVGKGGRGCGTGRGEGKGE
jgi:hypothetical protein